MMLNSSYRYKKLILALVCGAVSYSAMGKVYSWRDADGAMHYSQFPRQIVEKNAAQSRASRKQADLEDVVSELSEPDNSNLLDGLDDIVANANTLREQDKVLKRRDPQLLLIETQLAKQLAQKQSRQAAQETAAAAVVASLTAETNEIKTVTKRLAKNSFMAGVHKRVYGQATQNSEPEIQQTAAVTAVSNSPQGVEPVNIAPARPTNRFLAGIQNKLNRKSVNQDRAEESRVIQISQNQERVGQNDVTETAFVDRAVVSVTQNPGVDAIPSVDTMIADSTMITDSTIVTDHSVAESASLSSKHKPSNSFLAGIKNKLNRHKTQPAQLDEPVSIVSQPGPVNEFVQEDIQNKFLAEINRKLLRARLGTGAIQPVATSDDVGSNSNVGSNKSLIKSADKIKAIENEIGISNKSNSLKPVTTRQDDSTLMLSRLNNNHTGRLPLNVAGSDLLDRQGIDASSQFAREVNRNAEK